MNFIFDFDGTICDSFDITIKILNQYLLKLHKKLVDPKEFKEKGIEKLVKNYKLNKIQILLYVLKGRQELAKHIDELSPVKDLSKVIKELSNKNTLGIVSSNSKKNITKFLKLNKIDKYFKFIESSPTIFEKSKKIQSIINRFKLEKGQTIYVGDEVRDIEAAKKLGIKGISVSWGFANKNLLKKFKPNFLIQKPKQLLSLNGLKD